MTPGLFSSFSALSPPLHQPQTMIPRQPLGSFLPMNLPGAASSTMLPLLTAAPTLTPRKRPGSSPAKTTATITPSSTTTSPSAEPLPKQPRLDPIHPSSPNPPTPTGSPVRDVFGHLTELELEQKREQEKEKKKLEQQLAQQKREQEKEKEKLEQQLTHEKGKREKAERKLQKLKNSANTVIEDLQVNIIYFLSELDFCTINILDFINH